jgi:predicted small secreted protein
MQKQYRFIVSALLLGAFLLSACSGAMPGQDDSPQGTAGSQATEVVFTGTVQTMGGGQWQISGQPVGVDGSTSVDPNVKVGDIVRVEARVFQDGSVLALKVESSLPDDTANGNDSNSNDTAANSNDAGNANTNDNTNANTNTNVNSNDDNSNSAPSGTAQEFSGTVQAITQDSITINGVTYQLANFTEFKTPIVLGDQVKIHVIVNADGTLTIREIEKTTGSLIGNDNGDDNSNLNSNDDNSNDDDSSNVNSNDDDSDDDNSNDDDDNANDSNDND